MNNGKICVSIHTDTAEELVEMMRRAEPLADVIELRFDGLDHENKRSAFLQLLSDKQVLITMRPKEQGGNSTASLIDRIGFWTEYAVHKSIDHRNIWIDHEYDLISQKETMFWVEDCFVIRSKHYFGDDRPDLNKVYETVVSDSEVGKIAISTKDATDAIGIWKLLMRANAEGKRFIPIAMGEAGKWTRVLGPAHGAYMTYASLDTGVETAPGQITAAEMSGVFRARALTPRSAVYGVVAANTSYSVSPAMHNAAFRDRNIDAVFLPFQVADLDAFMKRMVLPDSSEVELNFAGFSVTNPHKQRIIEYLDEIDPAAAEIGAVNTVKIEDNRLYGYNTDAFGFISTLENAFGDLSEARVALFGAGGAARACVHALRAKGASVGVFARNEAAGNSIAEDFGASFEGAAGDRQIADDFDIVVNTTPLGTTGSSSNFAVLTAPQLRGLKLVYDLVYNPAETRLMREAKTAGVRTLGGLEMLIEQGAKQFEIWTDTAPPTDQMAAAVRKGLGI